MTNPAPSTSAIPPWRWTWDSDDENLRSEFSVEVKDGQLIWEATPDHDVKFGGYSEPQSIADFLAHGPDQHSASEIIIRELAAHLGLADPPWLKPLDACLAEWLKRAQQGDTAGVKDMLAEGMDINAHDQRSYTALWFAIRERKSDTALFLMEAGADVHRAYRHRVSALMLAAQQELLPVVQRLLDQAVDVNARDEKGESALLYGISYTQSPPNICEALVRAGATDLDAALMKAAHWGAVAVMRYVLKSGANVNARAADGWTPLFAAMWRPTPEVAEELIAQGADARVRYRDNTTIFASAASRGWLNVIHAALKAGVDVNARNHEGETALMAAVRNYDLDETVRELVAAGADVNAVDNNGESALVRAVSWYRPKSALALIAAGANPNSRDREGQSVLFHVSDWRDAAAARALIEAGADVNTGDAHHHTALAAAARAGNLEIVQLLIAHGADVNAKEQVTGRTPLWYASITTVQDALIAAGGRCEGKDKY